MRHFIIASGLAALLALDAYGQNTNLAFTPGKLAVFRGGDGILTIATDRQHPAFIDEYDPSITNQVMPLMSIELPTNGANAIWFNAHAGSEGQGMTRSADRRYLTMTGYCGDLNSIPGTPSSATNGSGQGYDRGFGIIDAFTNFSVTYHSPYWFGLLPGITQNNPRGIATDGSGDFWGCGTIAGTPSGSFQETGTLYWDPLAGSQPYIVQNYVDSAYSMKIINGVLYMVAQNETGGAQNNGVYNFLDNNNNPFPLPDAGNNIFTYYTNLFLNFGATYSHIETFDMNPAGTIAYAADEVYGIVKFVNSGGTWTSPYYFNSNNIGSASQPKGATGCFGIAVDFSGTNPVIYATTMDEGDGANTCSNRLISIVDSGAPDPGILLATTLAVASNVNEVFRGVEFTPDLTPLITSQPTDENVITNSTAAFTVGVQSSYPVTYQWQVNGSNVLNGGGISGATNGTLAFTNTVTNFSGNYLVIVSNQYGAVTSMVANLFVSLVPIPPTLTNGVKYLTNFIGNNQAFSVSPHGTPPFTYQWYFQDTNLGITQLADGAKYLGSTNSALTISNLQLTDSGSYYLAVTNQGGAISNLVDVLTVKFLAPSIPSNGEPGNVTMLQGQTTTLSVTSVAGTQPLSYQWYQGSLSNPLGNTGEFSGAGTNALTITGATLSDAANYFCVVSNGGGSATSLSASVTVLVPPALSYVAYSNQVYFQNFNSLPNPGAANVNTVVGFQTIGGITYGVANPFDFAYPLYTNITAGASGGLNLAATMPGWYGECDAQTAATGAQLGAADGSTTTGGIYSFGTTNAGTTGDRALGLIATSSSGGTHFGLKLINETSNNLNYVSLQYTGEFWKTGTKPKTMTFSYAVDSTGNSSTLSSSEILAASNNLVTNLYVTFPTAGKVGATNGHLAINQKNLAITNLALSSAWQPGYALWLVWSINDPTGSGQGYGIDNFNFYASGTTNLTQAADFTVNGVVYSTSSGLGFNFTTAPFKSAKFSVRATTNLTVPLSQWLNLGNPTETSFGQYQFTDAQAKTNAQTFYTVTSP